MFLQKQQKNKNHRFGKIFEKNEAKINYWSLFHIYGGDNNKNPYNKKTKAAKYNNQSRNEVEKAKKRATKSH